MAVLLTLTISRSLLYFAVFGSAALNLARNAVLKSISLLSGVAITIEGINFFCLQDGKSIAKNSARILLEDQD